MSDDDNTSTEMATLEQLEEALNRGLELPRRFNDDELEFRRAAAYRLRLRGMTYSEIGEVLGYSHVTARKDVELGRLAASDSIETYSSKNHVAEMMQAYDDILHESWAISKSSRDPEVRLKALQEVRKTINDKQKALMNAGLTGAQNAPVTNQVNITAIGHWSGENVNEAIQAILGLQLTTPNLAPIPDAEADLVDHENLISVENAVDEVEPVENITQIDLEEDDDDEYEEED